MSINHAFSQTSRGKNKCMNDTVKMIGNKMCWTQTEVERLSLEGERGVEKCKIDLILTDGAPFV